MYFQFIPQVLAAGNIAGSNWGVQGIDCAVDGVVTIKGIECLLQNILAPIPGLIALAAVVMIIIAGFRIVTSGADPKAIASAWATFTYAVIGLVLLSAVWLALVMIEKFTGANVTKFGV